MELNPLKIFNQLFTNTPPSGERGRIEAEAETQTQNKTNFQQTSREQGKNIAHPPNQGTQTLIQKLTSCTRDSIQSCFNEADDSASYIEIEPEELRNLKVTKIISKPEANEYDNVIQTGNHKPLYLLAENQKGEACVLELVLQFNQIGPVLINVLNIQQNTIGKLEDGQGEIASNIFKQVIPENAQRLGNSTIIKNQLFINPALTQ